MKKRGVSPVIAVLLLVVITVAAAVLVYIWLVGFMQSQTTTTGTTALGEKLKFEAVSLKDNGRFEAYVRNIGDANVTIVAIYLLGSDGQTVIEAEYTGFTSVTIKVGEAKKITYDFTDENVDANKVYVVKLVTNLGTEFTVKVKAGP